MLWFPQVVAGDTPYSSAKSFEELNLSDALLKGIFTEMKFERPSKIQAVTLPMILLPPHADLIAQVPLLLTTLQSSLTLCS